MFWKLKSAVKAVKALENKSRRQFFFQKSDVYVDPNKEKMRITKVSPYLLGGIVGVSWIFIGFIIFPSDEKMRIRAEEIMNNQQQAQQFKSADAEQPEEYRQEYIDKQKRKFRQVVDSKKKEDQTQKQIYEDYKRFGGDDLDKTQKN